MNKLLKQCPCCGRVNVDDTNIMRMYNGSQLIRAGVSENNIVEYINRKVQEQQRGYEMWSSVKANAEARIQQLEIELLKKTQEADRHSRYIEYLSGPRKSLWQRLKAKVMRHG